MSLDPSQLTLPQIAAAVAAGQLRLADAEGEFRRRPDPDLPLWQVRSRGASPRVPPPTASEVMRALDHTRRELRKATRNLEHLAERFESLVQLAARLRPEGASDSARAVRRRRPRAA